MYEYIYVCIRVCVCDGARVCIRVFCLHLGGGLASRTRLTPSVARVSLLFVCSVDKVAFVFVAINTVGPVTACGHGLRCGLQGTSMS